MVELVEQTILERLGWLEKDEEDEEEEAGAYGAGTAEPACSEAGYMDHE